MPKMKLGRSWINSQISCTGGNDFEFETLGNLGSVYASLKRREDAEKSWSMAASIFQELGERQKQPIKQGQALFTSMFEKMMAPPHKAKSDSRNAWWKLETVVRM